MKYIKTYENFEEDLNWIYNNIVISNLKKGKRIPSKDEVRKLLEIEKEKEKEKTKYKVHSISPNNILKELESEEFKNIDIKLYHGTNKINRETYWIISPDLTSYGFTLSEDELKNYGEPIDIELFKKTYKYNL